MAEKKKRTYLKFTSPRGIFLWPRLSAPYYGSDQFPVPDGVYTVNLVLQKDDPATKAFLAKLKPVYDAAIAKAEEEFKKLKPEARKKLKEVTPNEFYTERLDPETEEPTGELLFKFKMKAGGTSKKGKKWSAKPDIYDAKGVLMKKVPEMWTGTIGRVSFEVEDGGYFIPGTAAAGIALQLKGAQIIELKNGGSGSAADHGFEEEEGYSYEDDLTVGTSNPDNDIDEDSDASDDDDF